MDSEATNLFTDLMLSMKRLTHEPAAIPALRSADKMQLYLSGDFKTLWRMEREEKADQMIELGQQMIEVEEEANNDRKELATARKELAAAKKEISDLKFKLQLAVRFPNAAREYYLQPTTEPSKDALPYPLGTRLVWKKGSDYRVAIIVEGGVVEYKKVQGDETCFWKIFMDSVSAWKSILPADGIIRAYTTENDGSEEGQHILEILGGDHMYPVE
jgi:hypothetical protein